MAASHDDPAILTRWLDAGADPAQNVRNDTLTEAIAGGAISNLEWTLSLRSSG
jgi:hypothetical protein